jgi:hypothetical protein
MTPEILKLSLADVAAMDVAVIILGTLKTLDAERNTGISMLGMGLTALALASFQE